MMIEPTLDITFDINELKHKFIEIYDCGFSNPVGIIDGHLCYILNKKKCI